MGYFIRVFIASFLFISSQVGAAVTIDLGPSDYRNFGPNGAHNGAGIRSSTGQTVRLPPTLNTLNVTRNAVVPYGSVANGLRNFTRVNPGSLAASAAVTALFLAVDWAWDELTQEWVKYEYECPVGQICAIDGDFSVIGMCSRNPGALTSFGEVKTVTAAETFILGGVGYPAGTVVTVEVLPRTDTIPSNFINNCTNMYPSGRWPINEFGFPVLVGTIVSEIGVPEQVPAPVDFSELEAYLPNAPAQDVSTAAGDAQRRMGGPLPGYQDQTITGPSSVAGPETTSTSTDPVTGDTVVTTTNTTTNISYGDQTITTTNTTTSTTYQNGQETSTTVTTETPGELPVSTGGGGAGDWPGFCTWASVVCDFIDWVKEPFLEPDPELPMLTDFESDEEFEFHLTAECPEPYTINLTIFGPVTFYWEPFCDLARFIKPLVLASASLFAAFIALGISRGKSS
ncbi:MAG: zonular occludens toxin [Inoviridae sp.]|nr:MAG: zonular occludens toxin [Inoviridae sp.]